MKIKCQSCFREIPADNISLSNLMAKCSRCNAVFSIAVDEKAPSKFNSQHQNELEVPLPEGLNLSHTNQGLRIVRKWRIGVVWFMVFFTIFWNLFIIGWMMAAYYSGAIIMAAFGSLHAAIGIGLAYSTVAMLFNKTIIDITHDSLSISIGPVPWFGSKVIRSYDIKQIYCKEHFSHSSNRSGPSINYTVHAVLQDGSQQQVSRNLQNSQQALYIEQEIEKFLGIEPQHVKGAFRH